MRVPHSCGRITSSSPWSHILRYSRRVVRTVLVSLFQPIRGVWAFRNFVLTSVRAEFKARLARSKLGLAWLLLHPLAQAAVFAIVLSELMPGRLPGVETKGAYAIYLIAGLAAWTLFAEIVNRCMSVFVEYSATLRKIAFPRLCLPAIVGGTALLNHLLLLLAVLVVASAFGQPPGGALLAIPLALIIIVALAFGLGIFLGVLNVFSRDVSQVVTIAMQFLFWLTPIVYAAAILPERFRVVAEANPLTPLVAVYQRALLLNQWPDWSTLVVPSVLAVVLVLASFALFRRASADLVDAL